MPLYIESSKSPNLSSLEPQEDTTEPQESASSAKETTFQLHNEAILKEYQSLEGSKFNVVEASPDKSQLKVAIEANDSKVIR